MAEKNKIEGIVGTAPKRSYTPRGAFQSAASGDRPVKRTLYEDSAVYSGKSMPRGTKPNGRSVGTARNGAPYGYNGGVPYGRETFRSAPSQSSAPRFAQSPAAPPMNYGQWTREGKRAPSERTQTSAYSASKSVNGVRNGRSPQYTPPHGGAYSPRGAENIRKKLNGEYPAKSGTTISQKSGRGDGVRAPRPANNGYGGGRYAPPSRKAPSGKSDTRERSQVRNKNSKSTGATTWAIPEGSRIYGPYTADAARERNKEVQREKEQTLARRRAQKAAEKKRKRKFYTGAFFRRLCAVFLLSVMFFGALYYFNFTSSAEKSKSMTYTVKDTEKNTFTADGTDAYYGGVLYVDFTELGSLLGFSSVGSVDSMRFILADPSEDSAGTGLEEYIIFYNGMRSASVNGTGIIMEGACRTKGLHVFVPFSFVQSYIRGIAVEKDGDLTVITPEDPSSEEKTEFSVSLALRKSVSLERADYPA